MKIEKIYSHLNGHEWLMVHEPKVWKEIETIVRNIEVRSYKTKVSEERGRRKGQLVYAPIELNKRFSKDFREARWRESRTSYWVTDDYDLVECPDAEST